MGRAPGGSNYLTATDGTGVASPGGKADVFVGRGGSAGTITIIAPTTTGSATKTVVAGGNPGNGYAQSGKGGPGGPGGNVIIHSQLGGKNSLGADHPVKSSFVVRGGHGGSGAPSFDGGPAGAITCQKGMAEISITAEDAFRGGNGFNGCSVTPPVAGTNGGKGGTHAGLTVTVSGRSFNGGDGGSYPVTVTAGGLKGDSGRDGYPGRICAESVRLLTLGADTVVGGTVLRAGTQIPLVRVHGGHVAGPEANCDQDHVHGPITIDGHGPISDPDANGCGHGHVSG